MKTYLKFLSTISLLDLLKYSVLNLLFFITFSQIIINGIIYCTAKYNSDIMVGDFITLVSLFYGIYLFTCIIFYYLIKQPTKQKLPLLILNLLFLRFSSINTAIIDFVSNQTTFGFFFWVCSIFFIGIIYYIRFNPQLFEHNKNDIQEIN